MAMGEEGSAAGGGDKRPSSKGRKPLKDMPARRSKPQCYGAQHYYLLCLLSRELLLSLSLFLSLLSLISLSLYISISLLFLSLYIYIYISLSLSLLFFCSCSSLVFFLCLYLYIYIYTYIHISVYLFFCLLSLSLSLSLSITPLSHFLLCLLSRKLLWIFSLNLPGDLALKNGVDFW